MINVVKKELEFDDELEKIIIDDNDLDIIQNEYSNYIIKVLEGWYIWQKSV